MLSHEVLDDAVVPHLWLSCMARRSQDEYGHHHGRSGCDATPPIFLIVLIAIYLHRLPNSGVRTARAGRLPSSSQGQGRPSSHALTQNPLASRWSCGGDQQKNGKSV